MAKGLSSGYLPLGAVGASDSVFEAFLGEPLEMRQFMSGATYQGHPLCSAAGLANLEIIERENLVERCRELGPYMQERPEHAALASHRRRRARRSGWWPASSTCRTRRPRSGSRRPWAPPARCFAEAFRRGVFVRLLGGGNVHAVAPPFIITKEQIDTVVRVLDESIARRGEGARLLARQVAAGPPPRGAGAGCLRTGPAHGEGWSPVADSNRGPPPYHGGALPAELTGPDGGGARI